MEDDDDGADYMIVWMMVKTITTVNKDCDGDEYSHVSK